MIPLIYGIIAVYSSGTFSKIYHYQLFLDAFDAAAEDSLMIDYLLLIFNYKTTKKELKLYLSQNIFDTNNVKNDSSKIIQDPWNLIDQTPISFKLSITKIDSLITFDSEQQNYTLFLYYLKKYLNYQINLSLLPYVCQTFDYSLQHHYYIENIPFIKETIQSIFNSIA